MKIAVHTGLESAGPMPEALRQQLQNLWIDSAEEYLALLAAVEPNRIAQAFGVQGADVDGYRRQAGTLFAAPKVEALSRARPGGGLGCRFDPVVFKEFAAHGAVGLSRQTAQPSPSAWGKLPSSVRLMDHLFPVRNQGERGACVAFGTVALREFLAGHKHDLSEQFLYWACKELDGWDGPGTYIRTAMSALGAYGVCRASTWPYNPEPIEDSEGQGPPPRGATEDAQAFVMLHTRTVETNLIQHYKQVLAGNAQSEGMPVVVATLVFESWYLSSETHRTGKIEV
jgi:hypothetical protein